MLVIHLARAKNTSESPLCHPFASLHPSCMHSRIEFNFATFPDPRDIPESPEEQE